jgi:3-oxoacyl-[acyl-carrier protein] reductase
MNLELAGKVALVTGGSRGIGLAIASALAAEGCKVAIAARGAEHLAQAVAQIGSNCSGHLADVTSPEACAGLVAEVEGRWGRLDVLVANAGSGRSAAPGAETAEDWRAMIDVNLFAATNAIAAARPALARSGRGAIVCISSICGREALGAPVTYSAAKAALDAAIRGLAGPLAADGIRINGVAPGNILFPGGVWARKLAEDPAAVQAVLSQVPLGRLGAPDEIADAVAFLASARSTFVTGTILVADGGQTRS